MYINGNPGQLRAGGHIQRWHGWEFEIMFVVRLSKKRKIQRTIRNGKEKTMKTFKKTLKTIRTIKKTNCCGIGYVSIKTLQRIRDGVDKKRTTKPSKKSQR